jgi:phosphatidylglycerophosphate synthase
MNVLPSPLVTAILGSTFSLIVTGFRLFLRARKRALWWDDAWAGFSMICMCLLLTGILIFTAPHGNVFVHIVFATLFADQQEQELTLIRQL